MTLKEQLEQQKAGFITRVPAEVQEEILRLIKEQQQSDIDFGLKEGAKAPNFTLTNPLDEQITLYDELAQGPVILTFYRGSWCPFCNIQLRAYQQFLPEIEKLGGRLIAVSPQSPDNSLSQKEKEELTFQVLSDPNGVVTESYNLLFELPDYLQHTYKNKLGRDFAEFNNTDRWILPVPATFIIDKEGFVRRTHVDPDFMKRMEPEEIIDQLKKI
jgi:peroxiredoxin